MIGTAEKVHQAELNSSCSGRDKDSDWKSSPSCFNAITCLAIRELPPNDCSHGAKDLQRVRLVYKTTFPLILAQTRCSDAARHGKSTALHVLATATSKS